MYHTRILGFVVLSAALLQACAHGGSPASRLCRVDTALARGDTSRAMDLLRPMVESGDAAPERYAQMGRLHVAPYRGHVLLSQPWCRRWMEPR